MVGFKGTDNHATEHTVLITTPQAKYLEDCIKRAFQEQSWLKNRNVEGCFFV